MKLSDLLAYDSTRPELIPASAPVVLYYADGAYKWTAEALARFPDARIRAITVEGDPVCDIIDVESGDCTPGDVLNFLRARHENGLATGTVYCDRSTLGLVNAAVAKVLPFNAWLATLDGSKPTTCEGPGRLVAVQFAGGPDADYDTSVVWDRSWPRRR
jgi:hypothetical protein